MKNILRREGTEEITAIAYIRILLPFKKIEKH